MNDSISILSTRVASTCAVLLLAAGCGRDDVKTYQVPKEQPTAPMAQGSMPPGQPGMGTMPQLAWKLPEGWIEMPAGQMRVASFNVKGPDGKQADVSVIPLPGAAGGDFANVNRWRGQVGLQPVSEEELAKLAESVEVGDQPAKLYAQIGKSPGTAEETGILGVILHRDDMAWFFKMTGAGVVVSQQKAAFVDFLKSVKFEAGTMASMPASGMPMEGMALPEGHPPIDAGGLPAGHPDVSMMPAAPQSAPPSREGQPQWDVPAEWKETAGGQFLIAKFLITGDAGSEAAVNVSSSAGDGGGLAANVNRWRKQLGLGELSPEEIIKSAQPLAVSGGTATIVEMSGTDARSGQPASLVGVMVPQGGQTWYYKLMGDGKVVAGQKGAFTKFVQSVKY